MKTTMKNRSLSYLGVLASIVLLTSSMFIEAQTITNVDSIRNYTRMTSYDLNGSVIEESKTFFDYLGREIQTQSRVESDNNNVIVKQTIYDDYGRKVIETLPAPIIAPLDPSTKQPTLVYKDKFITNSSGKNYSSYDFDVSTTGGGVGLYYSNNNSVEPYVPATSHPYSKIKYDDDNLSGIKRSSSAGEALGMDSGHEVQTYSMASLRELDYLYGFNNGWIVENYADPNNNGQGTITTNAATISNRVAKKIITVDQNGQETVTFTSSDGKVLATCLSGQGGRIWQNYYQSDVSQANSKATSDAYQSSNFVDIHIPKGCENTLYIQNNLGVDIKYAGTFKIVDLRTGNYVLYTGDHPNLTAGYYRVSWVGGGRPKVDNAGNYYKAFAFLITQGLNYSNFSVNYYDKSGRLKLIVPPAGVDNSFNPYNDAHLTPNHKMITSMNYNSLGQLVSTITPDAGLTNFVYRDGGQVRFSQNALQLAKGGQIPSTSGGTYAVSVIPGLSSANNYIFQYIFPSTISPGEKFNVTLNFVVGPGGDVPAYRSNYIANLQPVNDYTAIYNGTHFQTGTVLFIAIPTTIPTTIIPIGQTVYSTTFSMTAPPSSPNLKFAAPGFHYYTPGRNSEYDGTLVGYDPNPGYLTFSTGTIHTQVASSFSYINYDNIGRIIETGEYNPSLSSSKSPLSFNQMYANTATDMGRCTQQNYIMYDVADVSLPLTGYQQNYLLGKVSKTWNANSTTWYSYDELGRVSWTVKQINNIPVVGQKYFTINYTYAANGNIKQVSYQKENAAEDFYYCYEYDADTRLKRVLTSTNNSTKTEQAYYYYYRHGALKRVELANKSQGQDYIYTINGWLKSINSPELKNNLDPGMDGTPNSIGHCPKDLFGMALDYYSASNYLSGDYNRINTGVQTYDGGQDQFNGMIKAQRWQTVLPGSPPPSSIQYQNSQLYYGYAYDNKYQLTGATFSPITSAGSLNYNIGNVGTIAERGAGPQLASLTNTDYQLQGITYDLNNNITALNRNGFNVPSGSFTDQLIYNYNKSTNNKLLNNRLKNVIDLNQTDVYGNSEFHSGTGIYSALNTYTFDEIGEQVEDNNDPNNTSETFYDVYGKVVEMHLKTNNNPFFQIKFTYDEKGYRIKKSMGYFQSSTTTDTWYVRDASGNVISIYENTGSGGTLMQKEVGIFADNRIGTYFPATASTGSYLYELTDHLGNVRSTFANSLKTSVFTSFGSTVSDDDYLFSFDKTVKGNKEHQSTYTTKASVQISNAQYGAGLMGIPVKENQVISGTVWTYGNSSTSVAQMHAMVQNQSNASFIDLGYFNLTTTIHQWVSSSFSFTVTIDGYLYLQPYAPANSDVVWFDDLTVNFGTGGAPIPAVQSFADYYPHGSVMPGRNSNPTDYRYGYQGQYAECDPETGFNSFELRNYDALLGKWNVTDPYNQYYSPYNGIGNNPVNMIDPSGGGAEGVEWHWDGDGNLVADNGDNALTLQDFLNTQGYNLSFDQARALFHSGDVGNGVVYGKEAGYTIYNRNPYATSEIDANGNFRVVGLTDANWIFDIPIGLTYGAFKTMAAGGSKYLYHYTSEAAAKNISKVGLSTEYSADGFIYLTNKANLSPLQAQIELALPANRALPNSILRIDASGLSPSITRRVQGNLSGMGAGGGTEFIFNQNIPSNLIKIVK